MRNHGLCWPPNIKEKDKIGLSKWHHHFAMFLVQEVQQSFFFSILPWTFGPMNMSTITNILLFDITTSLIHYTELWYGGRKARVARFIFFKNSKNRRHLRGKVNKRLSHPKEAYVVFSYQDHSHGLPSTKRISLTLENNNSNIMFYKRDGVYMKETRESFNNYMWVWREMEVKTKKGKMEREHIER